MTRPIALCIEHLGGGEQERYVRCTARPGREAGLALGRDGTILWCQPGELACEIWVTQDERLVAFRPAGAPPIRLERARRALELPFERPVFLRNQDELVLGEQRFVVHVHGVTDDVHPPRAVASLPRVAAAAAVIALGATAVECAKPDPTVAPAAASIGHAPARAVPRQPDSGAQDTLVSLANLDAGDAGDDVIQVSEQSPLY